MNKLYFKDITGEKQWIDLSFVSVVKIYERDQFYKTEFWDDGHVGILCFKTNPIVAKNSVSEKLNRYFNAKATMWDHE